MNAPLEKKRAAPDAQPFFVLFLTIHGPFTHMRKISRQSCLVLLRSILFCLCGGTTDFNRIRISYSFLQAGLTNLSADSYAAVNRNYFFTDCESFSLHRSCGESHVPYDCLARRDSSCKPPVRPDSRGRSGAYLLHHTHRAPLHGLHGHP